MAVSTSILNITIGVTGATAAYIGDTLIWPLTQPYVDCWCIMGRGNADAFISLGTGFISTTLKYRFYGQFLSNTGGTHIGAVGLVDSNDYRLFNTSYVFLDMGSQRKFVANLFNTGVTIDITVGNLYIRDNDTGTIVLSGNTASSVPTGADFKINIGRLAVNEFQMWESSGGTDVLVFDGKPKIRTSDGMPGLYDDISKQFFTNSDTTILACYNEYDYLTLKILKAGNLVARNTNGLVQYSKNGGAWTTATDGSNISVGTNDIVKWKRVYTSRANTDFSIRCSSACRFEIMGNIMSLAYGDDFRGKKTLPCPWTFAYLFRQYVGDGGVVNADKLVMPATTLSDDCYTDMFNGCSYLLSPPELPAKNLATACYNGMFAGCTSLPYAPELPSKTLAATCYQGMFMNCRLTKAPVLEAESVPENAYTDMFRNCTSLNEVECYATPGADGFTRWLNNVSATGTFKKKTGTTWPEGDNGIPSGWTITEI